MALFTIFKKLHRVNFNQLIPFINHSSSQSPIPSVSSSLQVKLFFQAFYRTPFIHLQNPHFSTLRASHNHTLENIIGFSEFMDENRDDRSSVHEVVKALKGADKFSSIKEGIYFLEEVGVKPNEELVFRVIGELRDEWELALLVFKWGERRLCLGENSWALMIWVLGNCKCFKTAWCLIRDMYRASIDTRRAMLVMIDRYTAANNPSKAIHTFEVMEKFRINPDIEAFHIFLSCLCKWGNIEEAEEFMLSNKKLFPLETESFNIILNGWCNISVDVLEAKRIWREMSKQCILPNAASYTLMISCFSKVGNLFDSLRLYDEMKKRDHAPGLEVYNSLVYVLTCENCLEQAMTILGKMKEECIKPNSSTYNSMIRPLCEAAKLDEARNILAMMIEENIDPTIETYHSFLEGASGDETTEILNHMKKVGLGPNKDTFSRIFRKLFKLKQPEEALNFQDEMKQYEIALDYGHYCVLVKGLVSCGLVIKAREVYNEMKASGFVDDPKLKKLLNESAPNSSHKTEKVPFRGLRAVRKDTLLRSAKSSEIRRRKRGKGRTKKNLT